MSIEQIQSFLSFPNVPDIVAYIIAIALFIVIQFVKKFVAKDNRATIANVASQVAQVVALKKEVEEKDKVHQKERAEWQEEKAAMLAEYNTIKKAIRLTAGSSHELVSNGTANEVAKLLTLPEDEKIKEDKVDE